MTLILNQALSKSFIHGIPRSLTTHVEKEKKKGKKEKAKASKATGIYSHDKRLKTVRSTDHLVVQKKTLHDNRHDDLTEHSWHGGERWCWPTGKKLILDGGTRCDRRGRSPKYHALNFWLSLVE